ncbi:MAG: DUF4142 domain-containing protein [Sphingobacteriaceae bacterium]|nr:MAG: DUF4142 domain-containing protein [Sphingobacteriaceae bacterium]
MSRLICSVAALLFIGFIALQGCEDKRRAKNYNSETQVDDDGLRFIQNAVAGSHTEIEASIAAQNSSKNPEVLQFAGMLIKHHNDLLEKLRKLQSEKMISHLDTMSTERQKQVLGLSKQSGPAFDKAYVDLMVEEHEKAVELFTSATHNRMKPIIELASKALPTIKSHLDSAKALQARLK